MPEKKSNFLKQYYNNKIKLFINEWKFYKENIEYSVQLSNLGFIWILIKNEKVETVFEKKIV
jgi:hypothetical protein